MSFPMSLSFHYDQTIAPAARDSMVRLLPNMKLLLLHPRTPNLPCLVSVPHEMLHTRMIFHSGSCCDLILSKEHRRRDSVNMRMVVVWEHTTIRCFLDHWFEHSCVYLGSHTVRVVQRAWLRFRERRRLALCMGWRDEDSPLARVLRTLCVEDLRRMVC
jgi:hypothetical protein